jgi:hypothetical protein
MNDFLLGIIAMSSFVATLFFLKFWKSTKDLFFLFFAGAFGIETLSRIGLAATHPSLEDFPTFYLLRLASFALILIAIFHKNKCKKG